MEKTRILCFGDSLTWGYHPVKRVRIEEESRWTGVLQALAGDRARIIEEGQNGRTIATEDPAEGEKNGLKYIIPCIESHTPLDVLIILLGANDLKRKFSYAAIDIAGEMQIFLEKVQAYNRFRLQDHLRILLVAPPVIGANGKGSWLEDCFDFARSSVVSAELPGWYAQLAEMYGCEFLDASKIVRTSEADGTHLEPEEQKKLGKAVYEKLCSCGYLAEE